MLPTQIYDNVKFGYAANVLLSLRWSVSFIIISVTYTISLFKRKEKNTKIYLEYRESLGIGQLRQTRLQYTHFLVQLL